MEVELEKDNGIHVILRREFKEKWEKHRGAAACMSVQLMAGFTHNEKDALTGIKTSR